MERRDEPEYARLDKASYENKGLGIHEEHNAQSLDTIYVERQMGRAERQIGRQAERQKDRKTNRQKGMQTEGEIE